jgi:hypothetical protein
MNAGAVGLREVEGPVEEAPETVKAGAWAESGLEAG